MATGNRQQGKRCNSGARCPVPDSLRASRGVTLIDTVVGTALLLLVFLGIFGAFQLSVDVVTNNRARAGAIALMNERMEYVRSLDYSSVGTVGGIPAGPIAQSESVVLSGITYTRRTTIQYADDPEDGVDENDTFPTDNPVFVDYKQARIEVLWDSRTGERSVVIVARVEPPNGEEIDCDTTCGTLRIDVLNAAGVGVSSALVHVVNNSTNPTIDVTTFTNVNGRVTLAGAPVASGYEVSVSKTGYNSAQTYDADPPDNANPLPGHQRVDDAQTTLLTLGLPDSGIDYLSTKTIHSFSAVDHETWDEDFANGSQIQSSDGITIGSGFARLTEYEDGYPASGELESIAIGHNYLARWREFTWSGPTPEDTSISLRFLAENGALIPDSALPGNAAGFTTSPVDLYGLSTTTYPAIVVEATLATADASSTPSLDSYDILYDYGPVPLGSVLFDMRGAKRIGTDPDVYKYDEEDLQTNASGLVTLQNMEWDTYTITAPSATGYGFAYSCGPQPEYLAPGTSQNTSLYLTQSANGLTFAITGEASEYVPNATVAISGPSAATSTTDSCGRAFFSQLSVGAYNYTVTANGYATTSSSVSVSGLTTKDVSLTGL